MLKHKKTTIASFDAIFIGWQSTESGRDLALYNIITTEDPSFGSTVTEGVLRKKGLRIPGVPQFLLKKPAGHSALPQV